jgi:hypothetical protein
VPRSSQGRALLRVASALTGMMLVLLAALVAGDAPWYIVAFLAFGGGSGLMGALLPDTQRNWRAPLIWIGLVSFVAMVMVFIAAANGTD